MGAEVIPFESEACECGACDADWSLAAFLASLREVAAAVASALVAFYQVLFGPGARA